MVGPAQGVETARVWGQWGWRVDGRSIGHPNVFEARVRKQHVTRRDIQVESGDKEER